MSNALDNLVADVDRLVFEMGSNLPPDETSRRWYASISAQFLSFNRRLRDAIKEERALQQDIEKPIEANNKAMREALVQCELFLGHVSRHGHPTLNPGDKCIACSDVDELRRIVVNALAETPRQCDFGTADEQAKRFENFCLKHIGCAEETGGRHCVGCPLEKVSKNITQKCELYWAQMPYEEGDVK